MKQQLDILILEDVAADAELMLRELRREGIQFAAKRVWTEADFAAELQKAPDLILADYSLPSYDGLSALKLAAKECPDVPFIFVSGSLGEETAIDALHHGARDYVLKQKLSRLGPAVRRALRESELHRDRKRAEARIEHLNDVLKAIQDINSLIVRERNPDVVLDQACKILVQTRGYRLVWIGGVLPDSKRVVPLAASGPGADYADAITVTWDDSETGRGPVGTALRTRKTVVCQNTATDPNFAPWRALALARGYRSAAAVPMIHGERLFGAVNVYASRPDVFDDEELHLLQQLADDLAFALQSGEHEQQRQQAEQERMMLSTAIEQTNDAIIITDRGGVIQYVNPAFERITGYPKLEALGRTPRILKSGKHDNAFYEQLWRALAGGGVWRGRFTNQRKDGTLYEEDKVISPVRDAAGNIVNYISVGRDVTRETQLEAQLRQAQKMDAIGRLAGGVAHDFNNLLQAITGYCDLALRELPPGGRAHGSISEVKQAGERAATLTRQLLAFSRKQTMLPQSLDLNALINNLRKMLARLISENIELVILPGPELGRVKADPGQIEQVIVNLCVNARDAMPDGGKLVIATANADLDEAYASEHAEVTPGRYVMLAVTDTGCGMTDEVKAHLFEPFFTTKPEGKGTGLGLSTVFGIVKQSGGHIAVYSEVGRGTTFKIFLPRIEEMEAGAASEVKAGADLPRGSQTVLLVEDNQRVRSTIRAQLEECGYQVLEATHGGEAVEIVKGHAGPIHLLLTDTVMPVMSGGEAARQITSLRPEIKVIFMSGYTDTSMLPRDVVLTGANFLQKPFTIDTLAKKLRDALEGR